MLKDKKLWQTLSAPSNAPYKWYNLNSADRNMASVSWLKKTINFVRGYIPYEQAGKDFVLWVHKKATIDPSAQLEIGVQVGYLAAIGKNCSVGKYTSIGRIALLCENVTVGKNSTIHCGSTICPNAQIANNVTIGDDQHRSSIESNVTIADDVKIAGNVTVGTGSKIGAAATIDSGQIVPNYSTIPAEAHLFESIAERR